MKPTFRILTLLWLAAILLLALTSCNPVKQVLRDERKTRQVVDSFLIRHPFKNDTITKYLPGKIDTVEKKVPYLDSAVQRVPCDSFRVVTPKGTAISVDKYQKLKIQNDSLTREIQTHRTDTLHRDVVDRSLLIQAQDLARRQKALIDALETETKQKDKNIKNLERQLRWAEFKFYLVLVAFFSYLAYRLYRRFTV